MKVIFVRHGEAMDDVEDRYGGWYDPDLSEKGVKGAKNVCSKLREFPIDQIITSPLRRTVRTAEIISKGLGIGKPEHFVYLKERNSYGLLCGLTRTEAREKYPELVEAFDKGEEVLGYESYDFFLKRVKKLLEKLAERPEKTLLCVTHGKLLNAFFKDILKKPAKKFNDNCFAVTDLTRDNGVNLLSSDGIEF